MDASEPSRKNKRSQQVTVEILGSLIALTTLILPVLLITNFSRESNSEFSESSNLVVLKLRE
jgi:hypothetical protein